MKKRIQALAAIGVCLLLAAASQALADVKLVQSTAITNARFEAARQSMSAQQKAALHKAGDDYLVGAPRVTTSYIAANRLRVDTGDVSILVDTAAGTQTILNRKLKVYQTTPLRRSEAQAGGLTVSVKQSGRQGTVLGHKTAIYEVKMSSVSLPGVFTTGEIWAAGDIPHPQLPFVSGPAGATSAILTQVRGFPLKIALKISGSSAGDTTLNTKTLSITQTTFPKSVFAVPSNCRPGDPYAGSPFNAGMGGQF